MENTVEEAIPKVFKRHLGTPEHKDEYGPNDLGDEAEQEDLPEQPSTFIQTICRNRILKHALMTNPNSLSRKEGDKGGKGNDVESPKLDEEHDDDLSLGGEIGSGVYDDKSSDTTGTDRREQRVNKGHWFPRSIHFR